MKARLGARLTAWFPVFLLAVLSGLSFWLNQLVKPEAPARDPRTRHDPDLILERFHAVRLGAAGIPAYTLTAQKLLRYPDDQSARLDAPRFQQVGKETVTTTVTSKYGVVSGTGDNVYFMDDVRVVRDADRQRSELTMDTNYLHVMPELGLARTDQPVKIRDANGTVTGVGLELRQDDRIVTLLSRVRGQYLPPKNASTNRKR